MHQTHRVSPPALLWLREPRRCRPDVRECGVVDASPRVRHQKRAVPLASSCPGGSFFCRAGGSLLTWRHSTCAAPSPCRAACHSRRAPVSAALRRPLRHPPARLARAARRVSPPAHARALAVKMSEELRSSNPLGWADVPFRGGVVRVSRHPLPPALDAGPPLSSSPDAFDGFAMPGLDSMELSEQDEQGVGIQARAHAALRVSRARGRSPRPTRVLPRRVTALRRCSRPRAASRALGRARGGMPTAFPQGC
jgi:hypothetical protein